MLRVWVGLLACATAWAAEDEKKKAAAPPPVYSAVTVTATLTGPEDAARSANAVATRERADLDSRPLTTIGKSLEGAPGVLVQQTSTAQVSPFLRGLTGYQVLNLIDGVRFNNSTFRSGPNQYLAFIEPSQSERIEAVLGPAGSIYGSDALGGTIQVLTADTPFDRRIGGRVQIGGATADRSGGMNVQLAGGSARAGWIAGASARRHNDLRAGDGADSRNALRRFFGLNDAQVRSILGDRMRDTAFTQHGAHVKVSLRPTARQSLTGWYQMSEQSSVDSYKDLWGGLGRMVSQFAPQRLHFGYLRYERLSIGGLDSLSGTFSVNSQADGSRRQGLSSAGSIVEDDVRLDSLGYTVRGAKRFSSRFDLAFGGDVYDEHAKAARLDQGRAARPLYPDGSRYTTSGLFAQSASTFGKLRAIASGRLTAIRFGGPAAYSAPETSLTFRDATFNGSLAYAVTQTFEVHAHGGRGFRAPNLNDLGAIGLNDLGYEIPASEAGTAFFGDSAGEAAVSTGRSAGPLKAESLWNAEAGFTVRTRRTYFRAQAFHADLIDPIVRRTLLYRADNIPSTLAGLAVRPLEPTAAQRAQGVVTVATVADPRAVKAFVNDGQSVYYGGEAQGRIAITDRVRFDAGYSTIAGRDLYPDRNIRRLPPQSGFASIRYTGRFWIELSATAADAQQRLSGGDRDDERIGASRSRQDIAAFFNGSRVAPYLTLDRHFAPTGETLAAIQSRVLPGVASDSLRVPMETRTAGWMSVAVRGGAPLTEWMRVNFALENIADRNYRLHGSGIDAAGINAWCGVTWTF